MPRKQKLLYQTQHEILYTEDATPQTLTFARILKEKPTRLTAIFNNLLAWTETAAAIPSTVKLYVAVGTYSETFEEKAWNTVALITQVSDGGSSSGRADAFLGLELPFLVVCPVVQYAGFVLEQTIDVPYTYPGQQYTHYVEITGDGVGTLAAGTSSCTLLEEALVL